MVESLLSDHQPTTSTMSTTPPSQPSLLRDQFFTPVSSLDLPYSRPSSSALSASPQSPRPASSCSSSPSTSLSPAVPISTPPPRSTTESASHWTKDATKLLIHLRKEMDDEFVSGRKRHEDLWAKILAKLQATGFWGKTAVQVNMKWNDLKKTYRKTKDNNRSTGRARKDFPYEDDMDEFMGEKASTNPQVLIDSHVPKADVGEKRANPDPATPKPAKKNKGNDSVTELIKCTTELRETLKANHDDKMKRMDRFLELFAKNTKE